MYGLSNEEIKDMAHIFAQMPKIRKVMLYGSRAKGTYKPFSDVDITLIGEGLTADELGEVRSRLSDSSLPYEFDVSLFANLSNPHFIDHIRRVGIPIYEKDGKTLTEEINRPKNTIQK